MTYEISWNVPGRVILIKYPETVDMADVEAISDQLGKMLEEGEPPVHLISDSREMQTTPTNIKELRQVMKIFRRSEWGWIIMVGANRMGEFIMGIMSQFFGVSVKTVNTIAEAEEVLGYLDTSLADVETDTDS